MKDSLLYIPPIFEECSMLRKRFFTLASIMFVLLSIIPITAAQDQTQISLLQWSHFVPRYDTWFDEWAVAWGEENGAAVTVDHINLAELNGALAAAIDAGQGPTIVEMVFPPASFIEGLHDLTDVNEMATEMYGETLPTCSATSYLPRTDSWYAYTHAYVPDPGNYDIALWTEAGLPEGPRTYDDLLEYGSRIRDDLGVPLGIGMSPELDSNMAMRAIMWSFGASEQDENENVVLNSPETIAALNYAKQLYESSMSEEVFGWNAASNNQGLISGDLSYILNSISAYRSLQQIDEEAANNIGFVPALEGPAGAFASSHVWQIYVIPSYVEGEQLELAKQFLLDHTGIYADAVYNSELYNFPCRPGALEEGQLEAWLAEDPFNSMPANKLEVLSGAAEWGVHLGYPGVANPAISQAFSENIIPNMFAEVARGDKTAEQAAADTHERLEAIFADWRARGLVGGGEE
jgi:multiple sugar transport system substrate-binding protein